jgi:hypothetical protein
MRKIPELLILLWVTLAAVSGVTHADKPAGDAGAAFEFRGEVTYLPIEGGFWGIVAADGRRYDPGALPREFQQPGLRVRVVARVVQGRLSFRQWGQAIDIVTLERDPPP